MHADGGLAQAKRLTDLTRRVLGDVAEREDEPLAIRELLDRSGDLSCPLARHQTIFGARLLCGRLQEASILSYFVAYTELPPEVTAAHVDRIRHIAHLADRDGDPNGVAHACVALGGALRHTRPDEALRLLERAIDMSVPLDTELTATQARDQLASLYVSFGRHHDALALVGPTLQRHIQAGAWNQVWVSTVPILIPLARFGDPRIIAQVLGAMEGHPDDHGMPPASLQLLEATLRKQLSDTDFEQLVAAGRALGITSLATSVLQVIDDALT